MIRRVLFGVAVALATGLAWLIGAHLPGAARALVAFLLVPLPVFIHWQTRASAAQAETAPRSALYLSSALLLWALAGITAAIAAVSHITGATLGFVTVPPAPLALWTALTLVAGLAVFLLRRLLGQEETGLLRHLIPVTGLEKLGFTALSLTAGFAEELVYRGFLLWALTHATGSVTLAVVISSALFGVMHAYQDVAGAARAAIVGAILAAPVVATGSLVPSMIAHAGMDVVSGLWLARWLVPPERGG